MTLHPAVLADLLDIEVEQARAKLGERAHDLRRDGNALLMSLRRPDGTWTLRLDGTWYDAEPFDVALVDGTGAVLPLEQWIPGFAHGIHSSLNLPWVCVSGTRAYYAHESHFAERWDAVRYIVGRLFARAVLSSPTGTFSGGVEHPLSICSDVGGQSGR